MCHTNCLLASYKDDIGVTNGVPPRFQDTPVIVKQHEHHKGSECRTPRHLDCQTREGMFNAGIMSEAAAHKSKRLDQTWLPILPGNHPLNVLMFMGYVPMVQAIVMLIVGGASRLP